MHPLLPTLAAIAIPCSLASAQCGYALLPQPLDFGVLGHVEAMVRWDPDGSGPLPERVVVAGAFQQAGQVAAQNLAMLDEGNRTFAAPPATPNGPVHALAISPTGALIVAGEFDRVGALTVRNLASFDGTTWSDLGGGTDGPIHGVGVAPGGGIVVGGAFGEAGTLSCSNVASWNGTAWDTMGGGLTWNGSGPLARAFRILETSQGLAVGGLFDLAGATTTLHLANWDGSTWSTVGGSTPLAPQSIFDLAEMPSGDLVVAGTSFGQSRVWFAPPTGAWTLTSAPNLTTHVYVEPGGAAVAATTSNLLRFQQGGWSAFAPLVGPVRATLQGPGPGDLLLGGELLSAGGVPAMSLAARSQGNWIGAAVTPTFQGNVDAIESGPDGTLYIGGSFTQIGSTPLNRVARWDGSSWQPMGLGFDQTVTGLSVAGDGTLYACGSFTTAGGQPAAGFARWNGSSWQPAISPIGQLRGMRTTRNGDVLLYTDVPSAPAQLARMRNENDFVLIPDAPRLLAVVELPDGRIGASGWLGNWGGFINTRTAIWDGTSWQVTPYAPGSATDVGVSPSGELLVATNPTAGTTILALDDGNWTPLPVPNIGNARMANLPNGDLVVAGSGSFFPSSQGLNLQRYDGTSFHVIEGGLAGARRVEIAPDGSIATYYAGLPDNRMAIAAPTCTAVVTARASGCASSQAALVATTHPYVGGSYEARATGLSVGVCLHVFGFSTFQVPLTGLAPNAEPGCLALVAPDVPILDVTLDGRSTVTASFPNQPSLLGAAVHHQAINLELDAQLQVLATTASNALDMTLGEL